MTLTFTLERHQPIVDVLNGHFAAAARVPAGPLRESRLAAARTLTFGVDVSHWQGDIDWHAVKAAGFVFVVIKATEGTSYIDTRMVAYRRGAHAAGLIVILYHYAGSSYYRTVYDPVSEASFFSRVVGPLAVGEGAALDYEPPVPPPNPGPWSRTFLDTIRRNLAVPGPWIYMNASTERGTNWTAAGIPALYGLWFAVYDNDADDDDAAVHWSNLTAEQYWDRARVPGIAGDVDVDVFYGSGAQLLQFCKGGDAPTPPEDPLSALTDDEQRRLLRQNDEMYDWLKGKDPQGRNNVFLLWFMVTDIYRRLIGGQHGDGSPEEGDRLNDIWSQGQAILAAQDPAAIAEAIRNALPDDIAELVIDELVARVSRPVP